MSFADIIGHERPVAILKRALANGTVAHAYLFSGEPGVGKKLTALAFAAALNCANPGPDGACGVCPSCRKIAALAHPDVRVVAPDGDEIKIDQVRDVQAELALKPFEGAKKILIVDGAEAMNTAAANAFLKTLEEPPGDALIVLVTAMPHSLLATIRSRCQEIRFLPLSRQSLAGTLAQRRGISEEDAWFAAALSGGSMGRALEMDIEQEKSFRQDLGKLRAGLAALSPFDLLAQADVIAKDRERFERVLDVTLEQLRDLLVLHETGDEKLLVNSGAAGFCRQEAEQVSAARILADIEFVSECRVLLDRRVSGQLVAENLLMRLGKR